MFFSVSFQMSGAGIARCVPPLYRSDHRQENKDENLEGMPWEESCNKISCFPPSKCEIAELKRHIMSDCLRAKLGAGYPGNAQRNHIAGVNKIFHIFPQKESACYTHFNQKDLPSSSLIYFSLQSPEYRIHLMLPL